MKKDTVCNKAALAVRQYKSESQKGEAIAILK